MIIGHLCVRFIFFRSILYPVSSTQSTMSEPAKAEEGDPPPPPPAPAEPAEEPSETAEKEEEAGGDGNANAVPETYSQVEDTGLPSADLAGIAVNSNPTGEDGVDNDGDEQAPKSFPQKVSAR